MTKSDELRDIFFDEYFEAYLDSLSVEDEHELIDTLVVQGEEKVRRIIREIIANDLRKLREGA